MHSQIRGLRVAAALFALMSLAQLARLIIQPNPFYLLAFGAGAPFFRAAQRAFIAAANRARPAGVIPPLFFPLVAVDLAADEADERLVLAHLARCAAAIFSRASGDMVRRPRRD